MIRSNCSDSKLTKKLNFESHIAGICTKASWHISAIARIAKYLELPCKIKLYNAFVRSNFQYCNIVWHFCNEKDQVKMEKVNKRALQVVTNDYVSTYKELLLQANVSCLFIERVKCIALETFKSL